MGVEEPGGPADTDLVRGAAGPVEHRRIFELEGLQDLRDRAVRVRQAQAPVLGAVHWTVDLSSAESLLELFPGLRLRRGFELRTHRSSGGSDGFGKTYAVPAGAPLSGLPPDWLADWPPPPQALDHLMEAIEGDESPPAYLEASLFWREAGEIGAAWHGVHWGHYKLVDSEPVPSDEWDWWDDVYPDRGRPAEWRPIVEFARHGVTVQFHTFSGFGQDTIDRHRDHYQPGSWRPESVQEELATGGGGYIV
jgi:hypothetical protein